MEEITGRIEGWFITGTWFNGYLFKDINKRWREGQFFHSSSVEGDLSKYKEGDIIKTMNSTYLLGEKKDD